MTLFYYKAIGETGGAISASIEANTEKEARKALRERGVMLTEISASKTRNSRLAMKGESLVAFTSQLAQLLDAGLPIYESLNAIEEQYRGERYHRIIVSLCEQIRAGASLSEAMRSFPESFNDLYCSMVAAGEAVGGLDTVLSKLATYLTKQLQLKSRISTALIYPTVLGLFALLVLASLLGFVIPSMEQVFEGRELNGLTTFVFSLSAFLRAYWLYTVAIIPMGLWGFWTLWKSDWGRSRWERLLLKMPLIRTLVTEAVFLRFSRTLCTLLEGGVSLVEALKMSQKVMGHKILEKVIEDGAEGVVRGKNLSSSLLASPYVPKLMSRMLAIGEDSGNLVPMLAKVADIYEMDLEKKLDQAMALLQPAILMFMGLVIGGILLAVLLPMTDVSSFSAY